MDDSLFGDPVFGPMNRLLRLAKDEDDRSHVLSMAAFLEDALRRLLLTYLRPSRATSDLVEGFNAPLGTLSARIKACVAFGLLTPLQFRDVELARRVRNEFAHDWEPCSLSELKVAKLVARMSGDRAIGVDSDSPKSRFHLTMVCVLTEIELLRHRLHAAGERAPVLAFQLVGSAPIADFRDTEPKSAA